MSWTFFTFRGVTQLRISSSDTRPVLSATGECGTTGDNETGLSATGEGGTAADNGAGRHDSFPGCKHQLVAQ